jgi:predicted RNA binding protein YcfA (HicA-like mRNA interferase family)
LNNVAEAAGFRWVRLEGSHHTFRNAEGRIVVLPDHGAQVIVRPLLGKILKDMGLSVEAYTRLLEEQDMRTPRHVTGREDRWTGREGWAAPPTAY